MSFTIHERRAENIIFSFVMIKKKIKFIFAWKFLMYAYWDLINHTKSAIRKSETYIAGQETK